VNVEVRCSDPLEHRRRLEHRAIDVPGLAGPTWNDVLAREYHPWDREHIALETAGRRLDECVDELLAKLRARNCPV